MADWAVSTIGELCRIKHGFPFKGGHFVDSGDLLVLSPGNFLPAGGLQIRDGKETFYDGEFPPEFLLNEGDMLIAMTDLKQDAPILGSTIRIPESGRYLHNQRLGLVRDIADHVDSGFLYYLLNSDVARSWLRATATGSTVRHTAPERIYSTVVRLPPIDEQAKIAASLEALDDLIENNRRRIEILEEMPPLMYREWFVYFRFPGHEDVELVDSELGPIPEGWEPRRLGDVAENFDRKRVPLSKMQRAEMQGAYPYYGAAKIFDYVDDYIFDGEYLLLGEDGTVVDSTGGPMLQLVNGKFWCNNHAHVLRGTDVSTRRLWCALRGYPIAGHVTGAAQPKITQTNMNRIPILVPGAGVADEFDAAIDPMIDLWFNLERQNRMLREARDLLLPRLVSGELDVSELDLDGVLA